MSVFVKKKHKHDVPRTALGKVQQFMPETLDDPTRAQERPIEDRGERRRNGSFVQPRADLHFKALRPLVRRDRLRFSGASGVGSRIMLKDANAVTTAPASGTTYISKRPVSELILCPTSCLLRSRIR